MPPKRNMKKRICIKQKREVVSRLMQISFKIDDYIYKEVAITTDEARNYLQEIHSYKESCHGDERSMQVIEKLTRLLQTNIEEQNSLNANINSQKGPEIICDITGANHSILLIDSTNTKSLDLGTAPDSENKEKKGVTKENPVESVSSNIQDNTQHNITLSRPESIELGIHNPTLKNLSNNNDNNIGSEQISNAIQKNKTEKCSPVNVTNEHNTRSANELKKPRRDIEKPERVASKNLNKVTKKACVENNETFLETPHQVVQKFNDSPAKLSQPKTKKVRKTEVDLSWVENIKYVREIDSEEFDPKLKDISETFWENCTFPRDWDDNDFLH